MNSNKDQLDSILAFKAKTETLFHPIDNCTSIQIEEKIKRYIQTKLDQYAIKATIVDIALIGSRCRGFETEYSDLDFAVEFLTKEREDVLFSILNEDCICFNDISIDINPITAQRTGTLSSYLLNAEDYLSKKKEDLDSELLEME